MQQGTPLALMLERSKAFAHLDPSLFTDITLVLNKEDGNPGGGEVRAHRVLLAASSPYFRSLFTTAMRQKDEEVVELLDPHPPSVQAMISLLYGSTVMLAQDELLLLLEAACKYQVDAVRDACVGEALSWVAWGNTEVMYQVAERLQLEEVKRACVVAWQLKGSHNSPEELVRMSKDFLLHILRGAEGLAEIALLELAVIWLTTHQLHEDAAICRECFQLIRFENIPDSSLRAFWQEWSPGDDGGAWSPGQLRGLSEIMTYCMGQALSTAKLHGARPMRGLLDAEPRMKVTRIQPGTYRLTVSLADIVGIEQERHITSVPVPFLRTDWKCDLTLGDDYDLMLEITASREAVVVFEIYILRHVGGTIERYRLGDDQDAIPHFGTDIWMVEFDRHLVLSCVNDVGLVEFEVLVNHWKA